MGLLDDAIREHLDLKRRRGADPSEVARQEQEALGPARRVDDESAVAAADPAGATDTATVIEQDARGSVSLDRIDDDVEWSEPPARTAPVPAPEPEPGSAPDVVPEAAAPNEDVLEETPEFLEDTPEHDRLWFEQRPPRDFDFDD